MPAQALSALWSFHGEGSGAALPRARAVVKADLVVGVVRNAATGRYIEGALGPPAPRPPPLFAYGRAIVLLSGNLYYQVYEITRFSYKPGYG